MSYVIYTSSGTVLTTVPAGKVNTSTTSLFLVGKDTLNYGRYINQNLVNMLTNFANSPTRPPANPQQGQLWFDSAFNKLRIYTNGSNFELVNQAKFSQTQPVGQEPGEFWFDLERRNLNFLDDQGQYQAITSFPRDTVVGWVEPKSPVYDNDTTATNRQYITLLESYGRVVGALSTATFIADTDTSLNVFSKANTDEFTVIDGLTIIGGFRASGDTRLGSLVVESSATSLVSGTGNSIYTPGGLGVGKDLLVDGDMLVRGSVKVNGTQVVINSTQTAIVDPVIDIGTGIDNAPLTIEDVCDKGIVIHYNDQGGLAHDNHAFMGYEHTQGKFMFKKNIYPGGHQEFPFDDFLNTGTYASVDVGSLTAKSGPIIADDLRTGYKIFTSPSGLEFVADPAALKNPNALPGSGTGLRGILGYNGDSDTIGYIDGVRLYSLTGRIDMDAGLIQIDTDNGGNRNGAISVYSSNIYFSPMTNSPMVVDGNLKTTGKLSLSNDSYLGVVGDTAGITAAFGTEGVSLNSTQWAQLYWSPLVDSGSFNPSSGDPTHNWAYVDPTGFTIQNYASGIAHTVKFSTSGTLSITGNLTTSGTIAGGATQLSTLGVGTAPGSTGEIRATGNITGFYSSDKKFKENIKDIENALEIVDNVGGKTFDWTDEYISNKGGEDGYFVRKNDFGVVAQDLEQSFPVAVRTREDGSLSVDYEKLVAVAFAAIKELTAKVNELEKKLGKE